MIPQLQGTEVNPVEVMTLKQDPVDHHRVLLTESGPLGIHGHPVGNVDFVFIF